MPKDVNKNKSINNAKTITELVICGVLLLTGGYLLKTHIGASRTVPQSGLVDNTTDIDINIPDVSTSTDPNAVVFAPVDFSTKDKFKGDLILVNNQHQYFSTGDEELVSIMEKNEETGRTEFTAVDNTYSILGKVYEPMAKMIDDFYDIYKNDTLIIYGSYRTNAFQKELYDMLYDPDGGEDAPVVAKPGFSEHESGYAFDFSETVNFDYQGDGDFAWINENSYKYGFIVRYPKDKENITEFRSEPWHFRYVGVPHATYMTKNDLCLEEYIDLLRKNFSYDSDHLMITDETGASYEVYFFPSDDGAETTSVPVPTGFKYDVSGNNVDGFIVTVHKDEKVTLGNENPEATAPAETPDETSEGSSEAE